MSVLNCRLLNLIAPEHSYTTCADSDLANLHRICTRCHLIAVLQGWKDPAAYYGLIIDNRTSNCGCRTGCKALDCDK